MPPAVRNRSLAARPKREDPPAAALDEEAWVDRLFSVMGNLGSHKSSRVLTEIWQEGPWPSSRKTELATALPPTGSRRVRSLFESVPAYTLEPEALEKTFRFLLRYRLLPADASVLAPRMWSILARTQHAPQLAPVMGEMLEALMRRGLDLDAPAKRLDGATLAAAVQALPAMQPWGERVRARQMGKALDSALPASPSVPRHRHRL